MSTRRVVVELHWYVDIPEDGDPEAAVQALMVRRNHEPLGNFLSDLIVHNVDVLQPWQDPGGGASQWRR